MRATVPTLLLLLAGLARADGDVQVFVDGDDLVVLGDDAANELVISEKGEFLIRGVGTTINGGNEPFHVPVVTGRFRIDLRDGDDRVDLEDARFPVPARIRAGDGDDVIFWTNGSSAACAIDLGAGDDVLDMDGCSFDALKIVGGRGADRVVFWFGAVERAFSLRSGNGPDLARIGNGFFAGRVSLHGGAGTDQLEEEDNVYLEDPAKVRAFELVADALERGSATGGVRPLDARVRRPGRP